MTTLDEAYKSACQHWNTRSGAKVMESRARILAERGVSSTPVTGHLTRAMQEEYERDANQGKMASAAIVKWDSKKRPKASGVR